MKPWSHVVLAMALLAAGPAAGAAPAAEFRAGAARVSITPQTPIRLGGRDAVSKGVASEIYARALALDDGSGGKAVIITTDLLGLPRSLTERAAVEIMKAYELDRGQILFAATGTRNAPMVKGLQPVLEPESGPEAKAINQYTETLVQYLVDVAAAAIGDLKAARVDFAWSGAGVKKKDETAGKQRREGRDAAVMRVLTPKGGAIAVLFASNTDNALIGGDFRAISGDVAGEAESALERKYQGSVAMCLSRCGTRATWGPWGEDAARTRGKEMATRVDEVLKRPMQEAKGRVKTALIEIGLPFVAHTKAQFEKEAAGEGPAARRARRMLAAYEARNEPRLLPYPVQVVRFDGGPAIMALGGEVSPVYAEQIRNALHNQEIAVVMHANEGAAVVTDAREGETDLEKLLHTGELAEQVIVDHMSGWRPPEVSMMEFGWPGPLTAEAEERILDAVQRAWKRSGAR